MNQHLWVWASWRVIEIKYKLANTLARHHCRHFTGTTDHGAEKFAAIVTWVKQKIVKIHQTSYVRSNLNRMTISSIYNGRFFFHSNVGINITSIYPIYVCREEIQIRCARESVWNSQFNLVTFYRYATTASWTWSWLVVFSIFFISSSMKLNVFDRRW